MCFLAKKLRTFCVCIWGSAFQVKMSNCRVVRIAGMCHESFYGLSKVVTFSCIKLKVLVQCSRATPNVPFMKLSIKRWSLFYQVTVLSIQSWFDNSGLNQIVCIVVSLPFQVAWSSWQYDGRQCKTIFSKPVRQTRTCKCHVSSCQTDHQEWNTGENSCVPDSLNHCGTCKSVMLLLCL